MKSVYLLMLMSCWGLVACIESNPQPMPIVGLDSSSVGDVATSDGVAHESIVWDDALVPPDLSGEEDVVISDIPPETLLDVIDGEVEVDGVEAEVTDVNFEVTDAEGEVTDATDDSVDGSALVDVLDELDGVLLESIEDPGSDG